MSLFRSKKPLLSFSEKMTPTVTSTQLRVVFIETQLSWKCNFKLCFLHKNQNATLSYYIFTLAELLHSYIDKSTFLTELSVGPCIPINSMLVWYCPSRPWSTPDEFVFGLLPKGLILMELFWRVIIKTNLLYVYDVGLGLDTHLTIKYLYLLLKKFNSVHGI